MLERWNPTVKAFAVLICVILLSFEYLVSLNLLVLAVCLLLLMFCSRVSLKKIGVILLPACIAAFGLFVTGLYYARGGSTQTMDLSSLSAMPYSVRAAMSQNLYTALQAFLSKLMMSSSSSSGSPTTLASEGKLEVTSTCSNFSAFNTLSALKAMAVKSQLFISPFFCFAYPLTRVTMLPIRSLLCSKEPIACSVTASEKPFDFKYTRKPAK